MIFCSKDNLLPISGQSELESKLSTKEHIVQIIL